MRPGNDANAAQQGFTLIAVMLALALLAIASSGVMSVVSQEARREREAQLLQVGQAYIRAIASFHDASPGSVKTWPREVSDLVEDSRYLTLRRHLRKPYPDPVTGEPLQLLRRADGTIEGVYSASTAAPVRTGAIDLEQGRLDPASRYSDWKFVHVPPPPQAIR